MLVFPRNTGSKIDSLQNQRCPFLFKVRNKNKNNDNFLTKGSDLDKNDVSHVDARVQDTTPNSARTSAAHSAGIPLGSATGRGAKHKGVGTRGGVWIPCAPWQRRADPRVPYWGQIWCAARALAPCFAVEIGRAVAHLACTPHSAQHVHVRPLADGVCLAVETNQTAVLRNARLPCRHGHSP